MRNSNAILITEYADSNLAIQQKQTSIFCEIKSVNRSEYYAAYAAGLTPSYVIDIDPKDYEYASQGTEAPNKITISSKTYLIQRTYQKNLHSMELTVG